MWSKGTNFFRVDRATVGPFDADCPVMILYAAEVAYCVGGVGTAVLCNTGFPMSDLRVGGLSNLVTALTVSFGESLSDVE